MKTRVSIIICTLNREEVLCQTLQRVMGLIRCRTDAEMIVVDQTRQHTEVTERYLNEIAKGIRWERVDFASLTRARNYGVRLARGEIILFLDDDVEPSPHLIDEHLACYDKPEIWGVSGCVLLPGKKRLSRGDLTASALRDLQAERTNHFDLDWSRLTTWASGCNMSFRRDKILEVGGFDEAFYGMAIGEDTEFCFRLRKAGGKIQYASDAALVHLVNPTGGCRDAKLAEERIAQMLDNVYYMFRKMGNPLVATWRNILWQCFTITINKKSLREWTWFRYLVWCVKGVHRAVLSKKEARLSFMNNI